MLKRLVPLLLAVVVGATPVAREICELSCAEQDVAPASSPLAGHHGGHEMAGHDMPVATEDGAAAQSFTIDASPGPHGCGHGDEPQAESAPATQQVGASPAVLPRAVDATIPVAARKGFAPDHDRFPGSIPISLRTPLRV